MRSTLEKSPSISLLSTINTGRNHDISTTYTQRVLERIGEADTLEKLEVSLPWNVDLASFLKNMP